MRGVIKIKRIYEEPKRNDGFRVLVDRLWPRGISKDKAKVDLWLKNVAPTSELRKWFGHKPDRWSEFQKRYKAELKKNNEMLPQLKKILNEKKVVTLLYGAADEAHNNAIVLTKILNSK